LIIQNKYVKYDYHIIQGDKKMEKRISATQAVRDFSELLNAIKFKGVHYIVERGGKPIAFMKPVDEKTDAMTLDSLKALLNKLPRLEEELDAFARDLEAVSRNQPLMSTEDLWE
jgi:antitoxin (DNA-binding transcriptional repressor) of toxin-antitoxin stability system